MKKVFVEVLNLKTGEKFKKYFDTEFERDKYIRKARYFKKLRVLTQIDEGLDK